MLASYAIIGIVAAIAIALRYQLMRARLVGMLDEKRYSLLESIADGLFIADEQMRFSHVNEQAEALLGKRARELVGKSVAGVLDPLASELVPDMLTARNSGLSVERLQYFASTGAWIEIRIQPAARETLVYLRDISERKNAELQLKESERRLRLLLNQVPAVVWTVDREMRFTSIIGGGLASAGLRESDVMGQPYHRMLDEGAGLKEQKIALACIASGNSLQFDSPREGRWLRNHVEPLRDTLGDVIGAIGVALDITEIKQQAQDLAQLARTDAMTRLPNRLALTENLARMVEQSAISNKPLTLFFIDVDRFKMINDTLGHQAGDDLLRKIADRLRLCIRGEDVIFRPSGDEFIVALPCDHDRGRDIAESVLATLRDPFIVEGREMFVTASIGVSVFPLHGNTPEELIKNADAAMYRAKDSGRNCIHFYHRSMHAKALERLTLEHDLRQALAKNELCLYFQPIIQTSSGLIVAAEALLRWKHPTLGEISPSQFIPLAEETGMIVEISQWVIKTACAQTARCRAAGNGAFRISINLCARDLRELELPQTIAAELTNLGLTSDALEIEVTENMLLNELANRTLYSLHAMGIRIVIDDFGIGYNSLAYIQTLPVSAIKIDKSFISGVTHNARDQAIVKTIVTLAKSLEFRVTAEGVESAREWEFIRSLPCDEVQGFHFSRPVDAPKLERLLSGDHFKVTAGLALMPRVPALRGLSA
ncbi:MAG: EAL domain-containing protein [Candidatus Eremiobacteraeota bacterium]|nr:EAL domain-containing protein [Candidatus Eremiobacteraeota bacterium]